MDWIERVTVTCFAASYLVTLTLEIARLFFQTRIRTVFSLGFALAGMLAHSLYLVSLARQEVAASQSVPLSSWHDFCLLAAWVLVGAYLGLALRRPQHAVGVFLLPLVMILIGLAILWQDRGAFSTSAALQMWRGIHGLMLSLGTAAVTLGFVTGVMYLVQSYRLKRKLPPRQGFRLPPLEWTQRFNREALLISTFLLAVGLLSGIVLNVSQSTTGRSVAWTDPVVLSSGILFAWLLVTSLFETFYRPARQGRKVAYLTLASFLFLVMALSFVLLGEHGTTTVSFAAARQGIGSVTWSDLLDLRGRP